MQLNFQAFFCKIISLFAVCTLWFTPQCAEAQACVNTYRIWMDCDADGQQGVFENGLSGVNVTLFDANCVQIAQTSTGATGTYSFGSLLASKAYFVVFGTGQCTNGVLNVGGKSHVLSPSNMGAEATDSDALIGGNSPPSCVGGKPYIAFTTSAAGCADGLLDAGFTRLDFQLNAINVVHETCSGNKNGSVSLDITNVVGGFSTLITGSFNMVGATTYNNLAPMTYNIEIRSLAPSCNSFYKGAFTINAAPSVSAPIVSDDNVCRYETVSQNGGLKATAAACVVGGLPIITWWTAQTGGLKVFTGATFNPITQNWINTSVVGSASFWAQSECNGCVSPRVRANFVIKPRPEPTISGDKFPCPDAVQTYTTPSVLGSNYVWSLPNGGGTILSTSTVIARNEATVTIKWNNTQGAGPLPSAFWKQIKKAVRKALIIRYLSKVQPWFAWAVSTRVSMLNVVSI